MNPNYDQMRAEELAAQLTAARAALSAATARADALAAECEEWRQNYTALEVAAIAAERGRKAAEANADKLHISLLAADKRNRELLAIVPVDLVVAIQRAEAAEAQLAAVPDYASYYTTAVQLSRISGETPMTFAAWLADAQPEVQP